MSLRDLAPSTSSHRDTHGTRRIAPCSWRHRWLCNKHHRLWRLKRFRFSTRTYVDSTGGACRSTHRGCMCIGVCFGVAGSRTLILTRCERRNGSTVLLLVVTSSSFVLDINSDTLKRHRDDDHTLNCNYALWGESSTSQSTIPLQAIFARRGFSAQGVSGRQRSNRIRVTTALVAPISICLAEPTIALGHYN